MSNIGMLTKTPEPTPTGPVTDRIEVLCQYCGEPILVAKGKKHNWVNPKNTADKKTYQSKDQEAKFHKHCRKLGRLEINKKIKTERKQHASKKTS